MPRRQPDFTLSKNDISEIKQIRDSTDLYDYKYKIAVTLLELDKQTPGKIIARELNLRQNTVTDIRKRYEKLGMNSFNKEPRKNAFEKKHIDADLIKLVNELNERGFSKTLEEIAEELNCSISTVQRALKRNGLRLTKDEKDYCDPNVISTIIDGFLLIFLQLEVASGYALLYTNNQDYKTFSKKIINLRKKFYNTSDGSSFLLQALEKLTKFNDNHGISNSCPSLKEYLNQINNDEGEFILISYGDNKDIENLNLNLKTIKKETKEEFLKILKYYLKSCDFNKNYLGEKVNREIKKAFDNIDEHSKFTWGVSDPTKPTILGNYSDNNEESCAELTFTYTYKEGDKTITRTYTKKINQGLSKGLEEAESATQFLQSLGKFDEELWKASQESAKYFKGECVNESTVCLKKKSRLVVVEGMAGRHNVQMPSDISESIGPNQVCYTPELLLEILMLVKDIPYVKATQILNNLLCRQDDPISARTINDLIHTIGKIRSDIKDNLLNCLEEKGYDKNTGLKKTNINKNENSSEHHLSSYRKEFVKEALNYIIYHNSRDPFTQIPLESVFELELDPLKTVYVDLDDVFVTRQNDERAVHGKKSVKYGKYVSHTNITIRYNLGKYFLTADNTNEACRLILAYLLKNDLIDTYQIVFTFDGAQVIRNNLTEIFRNMPIQPIFRLDWHHLCKRINELCSMALIGGKNNFKENKKIKGMIIKQLWYGRVEVAREFIKNIDKTKIKNVEKILELDKYLNNRSKYLCCYALRKKLRLINSSNSVEGANFQIVCKRQKHNGYSWGEHGSKSLVSLTALYLNNELEKYLIEKSIDFNPVPYRNGFWKPNDKLRRVA